jgi:hypothetical protein
MIATNTSLLDAAEGYQTPKAGRVIGKPEVLSPPCFLL